jgi:hypothetical protein
MITEMVFKSFRLMFDDFDWEAGNDNNDPDSYNWTQNMKFLFGDRIQP